ncbi:MAG TPA: nuclear transport factor 2 family protein [Sphingobacterium sp.]|nr:nuclear transport factor 2 family protein [Sphingobacterium sp.]
MTTLGLSCSSTHDESQTESVENAVQMLIQGMLSADRNTLDGLASEKLSYGHSSGKIENKTEFVETIVSGASVFEEIKIDGQRIDIEQNTAVVRHTLSAKTNDPGKEPAEIRLGIVLVWVKAESGWKLLARQAFKLP